MMACDAFGIHTTKRSILGKVDFFKYPITLYRVCQVTCSWMEKFGIYRFLYLNHFMQFILSFCFCLCIPFYFLSFRFGRDTFHEASKVAYRVELQNVDWNKLSYMVFDAPKHPGTYAERYASLGSFNLFERP